MEPMDCQMCGDKPLMPAKGFPYVECSNDNCWLSGPRHSRKEKAIEIWNRMQTYIAKGKLYDQEQQAKKNNKGE